MMLFYIISSLFLSAFFVFGYWRFTRDDASHAKVSLKGVLLCCVAAFLLSGFFTFSSGNASHSYDRLKDELPKYSESDIARYIRETYSFSELVDMYGDEYLRDYNYNHTPFYYNDEAELLEHVRSKYSPYDIWDEIIILQDHTYGEILFEDWKDANGDTLEEYIIRLLEIMAGDQG